MSGGVLAATVDGAPLPEDEARALWTEFSRYMDEHRGDAAGFARQRGFTSVTPTHREGRAVLVIKTKEAPPEAASAKPGRGGRGKRPRRR